MNKVLRLLLLILFAIPLHLHPASSILEQITFTHIGLKDGLSQSTIFAIDQDKHGHMWFATYDGLNKYDGYTFTIYQHNENDPSSIAGDIIRTVKTDSKGRVWIGTHEGLSLYNSDKDVFLNYFYQKNGKNIQINDIVEVKPDCLLVNAQDELLLFDVQTSQFSNNQLNAELSTLRATAINRQGDNIYIGTDNGLFVYSTAENQLEPIAVNTLKNKNIQAILQQSASKLWVGTEGDGLFLINPQTQEVKNYTHSPSSTHGLSSNYVRSLAIDSQNRLWVGTFTSLNIYREESDQFILYKSNPTQSGSLSQTSVRSIFMDSQGGMWLGTYFGGLNYYHPLKSRFKNIKSIPNQNSLNDNVVSCITEDRKKNLWIGTNSGGVNYYNTDTNTFSYYNMESGMGSNDVKAVYIDEQQNLVYIGTHAGGLNILNRNSGRIETLNQPNASIADKSIYAILPCNDGQLWLGTLNTLVRFNPKQKTFTPVTKEKDGKPFGSTLITTLFQDSKQRLWVGGEEGLTIYTQDKGELQTCRLLPSNSPVERKFINCVYESDKGLYWIGTRSGVYRFDEEKKEIKHYTTTNDLPNNVVHGILEDTFGRLWMSTDKGLACFNTQTEKFRNFTGIDGLQSNQFNPHAYCRTVDGQMYFGGIGGLSVFRPENIVDNPYTPSVVITGLRLFNKPVRPNDQTEILTQNICETQSITLDSKQTSFSLEFVVSNYISGQHNTFAYKLEGFDEEWYYLNDIRTVSYSNLPQGKYQFLVKAANSDGKWNESPTSMEIIILPVWYKTWWAILLFIAAFIGLAVFIFRFFWMRRSMETQLKLERMDKERQEEVNQMKMRFFIDISHELRTPLTLILAPLQEIMNKVSDRWTRNQLEYIQRNTNRLLHLVNQLMDYRRAELGVFELKVRQGNAHQVIQKNFLYYDKLSKHKKIDYNLHSELEEGTALFDANYLELIVNNLLSNAFKYTEEGQSITVSLKKEKNELQLHISDTGAGIPIQKQGKIFERFYQADNEHIGSGIGLSLVQRLVELHHGHIELESREGEGSTFSIFLPQDKSVYKECELASDKETEAEEQTYSTNSKEMYFIDTEKAEDKPEESIGKKHGTILIVEDNEEIRHYLSNGLSESFNTLEAGNGEEALEILREQEANIILTDVMMPVMDGIALCKSIKQNIRTCHIPVIMLSAKMDLKDQMEGLQTGADDYIPKPFSLSMIKIKMQNILRTHYRLYERYSQSLEVEPEKITSNPMDEELIRKAVDVVEKHMDDIEFSTDEFAREMCMSRSNLHLKMKVITGESTIEFIRKIRFSKACKLLKEGRYTVAEISSMVGFNTPSYFATSFKKYFGCLPTEYLKGKKGNNINT